MNPSLRSFIAINVVVAIGALVAWAGSDHSLSYQNISLFWWCALLAFVIQWLAFIPAYLRQTEHFYDLVGSSTYLSVVALALWLGGKSDERSLIVAVLVAVWAVRLGSFLFLRISQDGKDSRFDLIKPKPLRFLFAWTLQGLWVFFTLAAVLVVLTSEQSKPLGVVGYVGIALWVVGFALEVVADRQKRVFRAARERGETGPFITTGLWAHSRHPNYFGEILLWLGLAVVAAPVMNDWQWVGMISPIFVTLLLTRISGVPMLEKSSDKKWGDDASYQAYKARTPVLIPKLFVGSESQTAIDTAK
jgi:steroid 5-alpha reductase family enzyme